MNNKQILGFHITTMRYVKEYTEGFLNKTHMIRISSHRNLRETYSLQYIQIEG